MAVKGQPEVTLAGAEGNGEHTAPSAEAAVGMAEFHFLHAVLVVNAVVGALREGISAREVKLAVHAKEGTARFQAAVHRASADITEIAEGIVRLEEAIDIFSCLLSSPP